MADGTYLLGREGFGPFARGGRHIIVGHLAKIFDQSAKVHVIIVCGMCRSGWNAQSFGGTVENFVHHFLGQFANGRIERIFVLVQHGFDAPEDEGGAIFSQRSQTALADGQVGVGDYLFLIDHIDIAQTLAFGASALQGVEGKVVGCGFAVGDAAGGTHEVLGEEAHLSVGRFAIGQRRGGGR